jgi:hypothetical protein
MVKTKRPSLPDRSSGEVIKPGFVESPIPSRVFRRKKDANIWHSHPDCSDWPTSEYYSSAAKPVEAVGALCKKCDELHE